MERERFEDENDAERQQPKVEPAVYGDTDMDPNRDDQKDAHEADSEEHL